MTEQPERTARPDRGPRQRPAPMATTVASTSWVSSSMVRIVFAGGDLARFNASPATDAYVKVAFLSPGVDYPRPLDLEAIRSDFPAEHWPRLRTYTVRAWNQETLELTVDFVVHGDSGLAGPWAATAKPGDEAHLMGPGGGYAPDESADWFLFAGDESAVPAISTAIEHLPKGAIGHAFLEVHDAGDELPFAAPAGVTVTWLHRKDRPVGEALVGAVTGADFPAGRVEAFVHGEAGFVKDLRTFLRVDRGLTKEQLSISGYWRQGVDDEGWRAVKRDWNREVEESEAAAGV